MGEGIVKKKAVREGFRKCGLEIKEWENYICLLHSKEDWKGSRADVW